MRKPWTKEELDILIRTQDQSPREVMLLLPGRTYRSITTKRSSLDDSLRLLPRSFDGRGRKGGWTDEEIDILKTHGPTTGIAKLASLLPRHSLKGIYGYAKRHGYEIQESKVGRKPFYTKEQIDTVREMYPTGCAKDCAVALGLKCEQVEYLVRVHDIKKNKGEEKVL